MTKPVVLIAEELSPATVEALGPDLREVDFLRAIRDFTTRDRRYGG